MTSGERNRTATATYETPRRALPVHMPQKVRSLRRNSGESGHSDSRSGSAMGVVTLKNRSNVPKYCGNCRNNHQTNEPSELRFEKLVQPGCQHGGNTTSSRSGTYSHSLRRSTDECLPLCHRTRAGVADIRRGSE
jgi:hypothetical protein